jgi:hypothetical protein
MKASVFFCICLGIIFLGLPIYFMKGTVACEMTDALGFVEIRPNVFVSSDSAKTPEDIAFLDQGIKREYRTN